MKTSNYNMRINPDIKSKSEKIYSDLGLNLSDAINVFLQLSIINNGFPFSVNLPKLENSRSVVIKDKNAVKITRDKMFDFSKGEFSVPDNFNDPVDDFKEYV